MTAGLPNPSDGPRHCNLLLLCLPLCLPLACGSSWVSYCLTHPSRLLCSAHRVFVAVSHLSPPGDRPHPRQEHPQCDWRDWIISPNSELWAYVCFKCKGGKVCKSLGESSIRIKRCTNLGFFINAYSLKYFRC